MPDHQPTLLVINPVLEERADDFERWLRSVVHTAMLEHQPELVGRFRVLRAAEAEDGVVPFAFLFDGGEPPDWELQPLLDRALGADAAAEALVEMTGMLQREQYGWPVTPVPLDGPTAPA
jgi:hypothetical protein